ncbi:transposase [Pseudomonas sp. PD9R]|uniref:transposase n=1 Tax=Pseudomonas sp. PD9R TaxID=2853534 RepID=UPI001C472E4A|nr:transposase [Pseudomonas sp. PD9R]
MQPTRRSYSKSFKAQVIQECAQPGASIASIARWLGQNLTHHHRTSALKYSTRVASSK